jgi:hypothetical protein
LNRRPLAQRVPVDWAEPDLSPVHKAVVVRAVKWGWDEVCRRWPDIVQSGGEEAISAKLWRVLNDQNPAGVRSAPGLSEFETVQRGEKVEGVDGGVEYQPDLTFRPNAAPGVRNRGDWGWFVECKLVDGAASVQRYCRNGVRRFVDGRYAARMPSGAMLGYVRDGREPYPSLEPLLCGQYGNAAVEAPKALTPDQVRSHHERSCAPPSWDPIELTHIWLEASASGS